MAKGRRGVDVFTGSTHSTKKLNGGLAGTISKVSRLRLHRCSETRHSRSQQHTLNGHLLRCPEKQVAGCSRLRSFQGGTNTSTTDRVPSRNNVASVERSMSLPVNRHFPFLHSTPLHVHVGSSFRRILLYKYCHRMPFFTCDERFPVYNQRIGMYEYVSDF